LSVDICKLYTHVFNHIVYPHENSFFNFSITLLEIFQHFLSERLSWEPSSNREKLDNDKNLFKMCTCFSLIPVVTFIWGKEFISFSRSRIFLACLSGHLLCISKVRCLNPGSKSAKTETAGDHRHSCGVFVVFWWWFCRRNFETD